MLAMLAACATAPPGTPPGGTPAGTAATTTAPAPSAGASASAVAAQTGPVALVNPGFESLVPGRRGDPEGWFTFQHAGPKSYEFVLDTAEPHAGARSLRIRNIGPEPYGAAANSLEVSAYGGKVAHFSGWMRTRDVEGPGAGLTLLLLSRGAIVDQNFMSDRIVTGTTGWTRYALTLPIPRGVERLEVGAMLQGKGMLWLDDVVLEFVDP